MQRQAQRRSLCERPHTACNSDVSAGKFCKGRLVIERQQNSLLFLKGASSSVYAYWLVASFGIVSSSKWPWLLAHCPIRSSCSMAWRSKKSKRYFAFTCTLSLQLENSGSFGLSFLYRLQKVVLEMLKDRGMRLPDSGTGQLEMSFEDFREQYNGRCCRLFLSSPALILVTNTVLQHHRRAF